MMVGGLGKGKAAADGGGVSLGIGGIGGPGISTGPPKKPANEAAAASTIQTQWAAKKEAEAVRKEVSGMQRVSSVKNQLVAATAPAGSTAADAALPP